MGFNISQIINKFLPTKPHSSAADGWEDPFGTGKGQIVVSENEDMKKRMARLGQIQTAYATKTTLTQNVTAGMYTYRPTDGYVGIPLKMSMTMTSPGFIMLQWQQHIGQTTETGGVNNYYTKYLPNAGTWDLDFSGEITIGSGGGGSFPQLQVFFTPDNAGAYGWFSMIYAEELE